MGQVVDSLLGGDSLYGAVINIILKEEGNEKMRCVCFREEIR